MLRYLSQRHKLSRLSVGLRLHRWCLDESIDHRLGLRVRSRHELLGRKLLLLWLVKMILYWDEALSVVRAKLSDLNLVGVHLRQYGALR